MGSHGGEVEQKSEIFPPTMGGKQIKPRKIAFLPPHGRGAVLGKNSPKHSPPPMAMGGKLISLLKKLPPHPMGGNVRPWSNY